jgi:diguanylate cyclase (GGDEF)-like protein
MKFSFFPSRAQRATNASPDSEPDSAAAAQDDTHASVVTTLDAERLELAGALHQLLRGLSHENGGRNSLRRVCEVILAATPKLRLVWVGFCHDDIGAAIEPTAVMGPALAESGMWQLPKDSFDFVAPYTQVVDWHAAQEHEFHALFTPWQNNQQQCSATNALAIPLRVEKSRMCGMIVFYADDPEYFSATGLASFQAFGHVCEVIWKQSHVSHLLSQHTRLDRLTGLLNRQRVARVFERSVAEALQTEPAQALSVIYCCLHDFGKLSALYGWVAADNMLAAFARATSAQLRETDKGGRWSSTEFLYVLPGADADLAASMVASFIAYFKQSPVIADNWSIRIGFSVGAATYGADGRGLDELLHHASQNMRNSAAPTVAYDSPAYDDAVRWRAAATALNGAPDVEPPR